MGISANAATFMIIPMTFAGIALCVPHILWMNLLGCLLILLAEVFDCVDGEIARWTKKSSAKGFYLDLITHVLCNGPLSLICGLHLYVLTKQYYYMILAFIAFGIAQMELGLRDSYCRVLCENLSSKEGRIGKDVSSSNIAANVNSNDTALVVMVKWLLHGSTDNVVVRLISAICVLLSYLGTSLPLRFFVWLLPTFGIMAIAGDVANKYFRLIPNLERDK